MNSKENYQLIDHAGKVIAMGTQDQMFSYVKHHVPDGRYRIVGPDLKLLCLRMDGVVQIDPDGFWLSVIPVAGEKKDGDEE